MSSIEQILRILSDGRFHSGEHIAQELGISRGGVWKALGGLRKMGLDIYAVRGRGYKLADPVELLDSEQIRNALDLPLDEDALEVHWSIDSTNQYLMRRIYQGIVHGHTVLSETQTQGRGRRGRVWCSPFGNIFLSQYWKFSKGPGQLNGISLACAIAVARALEDLGIEDVRLKWPNDILIKGEKLAGILLEVAGETAGPTHMVMGLGLNMRMPPEYELDIDQAYTDLHKVCGRAVPRNQLVAAVLNQLATMLVRFQVEGFQAFHQQWQALDAYYNRTVVLQLPDGPITGVAKGVNADGALGLHRGGQIHWLQSGEISLRVKTPTPA